MAEQGGWGGNNRSSDPHWATYEEFDQCMRTQLGARLSGVLEPAARRELNAKRDKLFDACCRNNNNQKERCDFNIDKMIPQEGVQQEKRVIHITKNVTFIF